jgi:DnaK suppressor protein
MWMTREEIAKHLGIVVNSVRGKVQKGQIERKVEEGKNYYRVVGDTDPTIKAPSPPEQPSPQPEQEKPIVQTREEITPPPDRVNIPDIPKIEDVPFPERPQRSEVFNPKKVLLDELASLRVERNIDAIEKGDEIDLATGEISRDLAAKISMRHYKQLKEIEDALERLKTGEYGMCEECGEPIPEQRLRLFPAARLCVRCQEDYDQLEKLKDNQAMRGGAWREEPSEGTFARSFED